MKKLFFSVIAVAIGLGMQAQFKEGFITYSMNIEGLPPEAQSMMKGAEMKVYFKDKKARIEMTNAFVTSTTVADENSSTTTMEQMGQKSYFKMTKAEMEKQKEKSKSPEPKITYTNEKKTICGYECEKAVIESKDEKGQDQKMIAWVTDKLPNHHHMGNQRGGNHFKNLKGAALEYSMNQGPMKISFLATTVSNAPVPDSKFVLSTDGYTEIKYDDMKKMQGMGGGGQ